jgi:hypothetical protein
VVEQDTEKRPRALESALRLTLRRLKKATPRQILKEMGETYPPATKYRVLKILKESPDFAEHQAGEITMLMKGQPYKRQSEVWVYRSRRQSYETTQRASEEPQILLTEHRLLSTSVSIYRFGFEIRAGKTAIDALEVQVSHGYGLPGEWVNLDLRDYDFNEVEKGKEGDPVKRISLLSHDIQRCTFVTFHVMPVEAPSPRAEIRFTMRTFDSTKQPKFAKLGYEIPFFEVYARFVGLPRPIEKRYVVVYNKPPWRPPSNEPVELVDASSDRGKELVARREGWFREPDETATPVS